MAYINGSNALLAIGGEALGHCTTHTFSMSAETKERAVKPVASDTATTGLWKNKGITGLSISISGEGYIYSGETEYGFDKLMAAMASGKSVTVTCFARGNSESPYFKGSCVITSLERSDPAQDDSTFTVGLENDGEPDTLDQTQVETYSESTSE